MIGEGSILNNYENTNYTKCSCCPLLNPSDTKNFRVFRVIRSLKHVTLSIRVNFATRY